MSAAAPRARRFFRGGLISAAFAYPLVLIVLALALYRGAESWWVTTALLYAPRIVFALPLPLIALGLLLSGLRKLLWSQLVALLVLLFPLLGLVLPWPASATADVPRVRLLSFNANSGFFGAPAIVREILAANPDIVLIQEGQFGGGELSEALHARYPYVQASTQFTVASRFPIVSATDPERLPYFGRQRSPRFMRYLIQTPLGEIACYSVHPISPRGALHIHRFRDVLHQLRTGAFLTGDPEADVVGNAGLRALQIEAAANLAAREQVPVIVAGDTNLPGLSSILRKHLARYADAFRTASWGFGYTFPANHPFLRLDRILGGPELHFTSFRVGCPGVSDHLCVVAEIERHQ